MRRMRHVRTLVDVLGEHDYAGVVGVGDKVHGTTHALDKLAGDHEVGQVTVGRDLEGTQHGHVEVATTNNVEAVGGVERGRAGHLGDRLLARVDAVRVALLAGLGVWAHTLSLIHI